MAQKVPKRFLDLSGELRNAIYGHAFGPDGGFPSALLATCKQVYAEIEPDLYKDHVFRVTVDRRGCRVDGRELNDWRKMETWPVFLKKAQHVSFSAVMDDAICVKWHAECGFFAMCKFLESRNSLRKLSLEFRRENHEISADNNFPAQMIIPRYLFLQPQVEVTLTGVDDVHHLEHHQAQMPVLLRLERSHTVLRGLLEIFSESMLGEGECSKYVPQSFGNTRSIQQISSWFCTCSDEVKDDGFLQLQFAAMLHEWRMFQQRRIAYNRVISSRDASWIPIICSVAENAFAAISLRRQAGGRGLGEAPMADLSCVTRS
jgi:hypothetical protein